MPDVEITSFREEQITEIDREGRVTRQVGRLPRAPVRATTSALATAIHTKLEASRHDPMRGAGGGRISVTIGRVTVERPVYRATKEANRLARELGGLR